MQVGIGGHHGESKAGPATQLRCGGGRPGSWSAAPLHSAQPPSGPGGACGLGRPPQAGRSSRASWPLSSVGRALPVSLAPWCRVTCSRLDA